MTIEKIFLDGNGKKYLAEVAKSSADAECPFVSASALAVLAAATVPLDDVELAAAMQISKDYPEVLEIPPQEEVPGNA